jgi:ABC-2 type transport system permease protein
MHNLGVVVSFEFIRTIKKKSFWLSLLAFPVIMILVFGLSYLSGKSAEDVSDKNNQEKFSLVVLDESDLVLPELLKSVEAGSVSSKEEGISHVKSGKVEAFIYYPADPATQTTEVYAKDAGLVKNGKYTATADALLKTSVVNEVGSAQKVSIIQGGAKSDLKTYIDGEEAKGFERVIAPGALLVLFYAIIILLANQMLSSTTEEKENRVIEMILTSVRSKTLIVGKILALVLLGMVQVTVISLPAIIAFVFFRDQLNLPAINLSDLVVDPVQMATGIVFFIFSFMFFTGLLVAIGASVPTAKEANNFFGISVFGMFVPLYAVMAVITSPEQLIVKIFTLFPLTAPVTLLLRNAVGNLQLWETIIGTLVLVLSGVIALMVATRAFSQGTLEYDRKLSLRELFRR